jgi:integrase
MKKPFYRTERACWYIKDKRGRFIRLDPDEDKAFTMWQRMRDLANYKHPAATIEAILEAFLRELEVRITPERMDRYVLFFDGFCDFMGPTTQARSISGSDVLRWVKAPKKGGRVWSIARQRDAGQSIKRGLSWAIRRGYLPWSDVLELQFAQPLPRASTLTAGTHAKLMQACRGQKRSRAFGLVLIALRLSPARPIQVREVTAANFNGSAWVFRRHKTAGKTHKPLVVHCPPCLATLTRILAHFRPEGPLFRTALDAPWTKDGIVRRFRRICEKEKIEGVTAYSYRHSFATDALEAGTDIVTVAALMGHTDTAMVARVYGHLDQRTQHLQSATAKIHQARRLDGG